MIGQKRPLHTGLIGSRIQASRSQTMMVEKLIDAEKFAGLGQLANNVTRQLNNPLTVILGYASLLEVSPAMSPQERKGIEAILSDEPRPGAPAKFTAEQVRGELAAAGLETERFWTDPDGDFGLTLARRTAAD